MKAMFATVLLLSTSLPTTAADLSATDQEVLAAAAKTHASARQYVNHMSQQFCKPYDFEVWIDASCVYPQSLGRDLLEATFRDLPKDLQRELVRRNSSSVNLSQVQFAFGSTVDHDRWRSESTPYSEVFLSLPAISPNGDSALIYRRFSCHNDGDCGAGVLILFEFVGGEWVVEHVRRLYTG